MQTHEIIEPVNVTGSAVNTLKNIGRRHYRKLFFTLLLVIAENVTYLLYPLLSGFAINAIVAGKAWHAVFMP